MTQLPRITIVTSSFNQAKYLPETIESILNQNYPNLEYIIIDGGSTDGSVDIIKKYQSHLAYWVSEKDSGQSEAINKGFSKATGDLFNWINSDDILFPGALFRIAEAYIKNPDADLIIGDVGFINAEGSIIWVSPAPTRMALSPAVWLAAGPQQSTFCSSRSYKKVGGVQENLHLIMDFDLYYRICINGSKSTVARGMVGAWRKHSESKTSAISRHLWEQEHAAAWKKYGISKTHLKVAKLRYRFCRALNGSYFRAFILLRQWKGKKPWQSIEPYTK
jgi:glycosyltransferase involved in cell wall biosynthesis